MKKTNHSYDQRPLSPHLWIYRPQITSVLSILHRVTGAANAVALLVLTWWLFALWSGPEAYAYFVGCMASMPGLVLLVGWSISLYYHLCNGIRHLIWDTGRLLNIKDATRAGIFVLALTAILTVATWVYVFLFHPGLN